ncbi:hypothetical protein Tco_0178743 [Tanacetum coccineum]
MVGGWSTCSRSWTSDSSSVDVMTCLDDDEDEEEMRHTFPCQRAIRGRRVCFRQRTHDVAQQCWVALAHMILSTKEISKNCIVLRATQNATL